MNLDFKRFQREQYAEYASWFADPNLNHQLGPMDEEWLDSILSEPESAGITWAVFRGDELVAVVETVFDPHHQLPAAIAAIATKPTLRRQGIAAAALHHILTLHHTQGITEHIAYVSTHNPAGRRCLEKVGFIQAASEPNEHGYHEFRRQLQ
jgi:RimJ/RimL family protein N-acetyltransferase